MGQPTPDEFSIPGTSVGPTRKAKPVFLEASNDGVGTVLLLEQFENCSNGTLDFLIGIKRDLIAVENQADRQRKTQFAFLRLIELSAVEAPAEDVQFRLRKGALHAK